MLLLCDGGGSNASNRYVFKYHFEQLANRLGLKLRMAHYTVLLEIQPERTPPVSARDASLSGLAADVARGRSRDHAEDCNEKGIANDHMMPGEYPLKEGYPEEYRETMKIRFDEELPAWNYRAVPAKWDSY